MVAELVVTTTEPGSLRGYFGTSLESGWKNLRRGCCKFKMKNQVVESRSTQVRTIHECDTQLLYGASGPTVSEDGSCRASDTCALQGNVQMSMR